MVYHMCYCYGMETKRTKHATYKIGYHMVWCPKFKKAILQTKLPPLSRRKSSVCANRINGRLDLLMFRRIMCIFLSEHLQPSHHHRLSTHSKGLPLGRYSSNSQRSKSSYGEVHSGLARSTWEPWRS